MVIQNMSDIRFIMIGASVVFSGFVVLGIFGENFQSINIEKAEFGICFEYSENKDPNQIDCESKMFEQNLFFVIVISILVAGVLLLIKGSRGNWDNKVKPEDMVGPSKDNRSDSSQSD